MQAVQPELFLRERQAVEAGAREELNRAIERYRTEGSDEALEAMRQGLSNLLRQRELLSAACQRISAETTFVPVSLPVSANVGELVDGAWYILCEDHRREPSDSLRSHVFWRLARFGRSHRLPAQEEDDGVWDSGPGFLEGQNGYMPLNCWPFGQKNTLVWRLVPPVQSVAGGSAGVNDSR